MTEARQMGQLAVAIAALGAFAWLYSAGGIWMKALRRYLGSAVFVASCLGLAVWSKCFSWWMLLAWPALAAALTLGYDADPLTTKLRRRALYGLAVGASSVPFLLPMGLWNVALFQIGLAVAASVFYGVVNPQSARSEEGIIGALLVACWPFAAIR